MTRKLCIRGQWEEEKNPNTLVKYIAKERLSRLMLKFLLDVAWDALI